MKSGFKWSVCALAAAWAMGAQAQNYPTKPVRGVLTFPPGSVVDIVGRIYMQKLSEYWGQNVLADNRPGAGGTIGAGIVAHGAPDGYTLLIHSNGHAVAPAIYAKLPYDAVRDFTAIAPLIEQPNVLVVAPNSGFKTLGDFLARARQKPGSINFASAGVGSGTHLNLEKFKVVAKVNLTHVPYKGSGEVLVDVMGGRVDSYFAPIAAAVSSIKSGKLRGLAVSTKARSKILPDIPAMAEAGVPNFDFSIWMGVWGPKGLPAGLVNKIAADIKRASSDAGAIGKLETVGCAPFIMAPAAFDKFVRSEIRDIAGLLKVAGVKPR
jgi:tripartite-type tricarboxylate transporter receptor subunit TctC